jgi:hypothetical protein
LGEIARKGLAEMADETTTTTEETTEEITQDQTPDTQAELERTRAALKAANRESAERRKRLEELEALEAERKAAAMTDLEKAEERAKQAEASAEQARQETRETLIRAAFVSEAAKAGAAHPEDVYLLANRVSVEITDGRVEGVAEAVKALVDAGRIPVRAAGAPNLDGGAGGQQRTHTEKLTPLELDLAKKMGLTLDQYGKQKAAIAARKE